MNKAIKEIWSSSIKENGQIQLISYAHWRANRNLPYQDTIVVIRILNDKKEYWLEDQLIQQLLKSRGSINLTTIKPLANNQLVTSTDFRNQAYQLTN